MHLHLLCGRAATATSHPVNPVCRTLKLTPELRSGDGCQSRNLSVLTPAALEAQLIQLSIYWLFILSY